MSNDSNNTLTKFRQFPIMSSLTCITTGIRHYCNVRVSTGTTGETWPFKMQCKDTSLANIASERSEFLHDGNVLGAPSLGSRCEHGVCGMHYRIEAPSNITFDIQGIYHLEPVPKYKEQVRSGVPTSTIPLRSAE